MSVQFRLKGMRRSNEMCVSLSYGNFHTLREALAEAIGFKEWIEWQKSSMKKALFGEPFPEPPQMTLGYWANGFDAFCNSCDCEGSIPMKDMDSLAHLLGAVSCIRPFRYDSNKSSDWTWLDHTRRDLRWLVDEGVKTNKPLVWD